MIAGGEARSIAGRLQCAGGAAALLALSVALFVPGLTTIPPVDRDEPRYAQASRQMLEERDFLDIRFQDEPRYKKPVGIYWMQAASAALSGRRDDIAPYRVPSLLGAVAAVLLTAWAGTVLFGGSARLGFLAAAMLASSSLLGVEARLATTDAVLLAAVVAAEGAMACAYLDRSGVARRRRLLFWIAIGVGVLVKGPIILIVCAGTLAALLAFDRSLAWFSELRPLGGAALAFAIAAPWLVAIGWKSGGHFFDASVGHDFLGKLIAGQEFHSGPPGYHLAAFWLAFWPFSLFAPAAAAWAWRHRAEPAVRFALAWTLPAWIAFEIAATKLPHYVLPMYPAIALLIARAIEDGAALLTGRWRRATLALWAFASGGLVLAVGAAPIALERRFFPAAAAAAIGAAALCVLALRLLDIGRRRAAAWSLVAASLAVHPSAFALVAPQLDSLWLSRRAAALVASTRPCPGTRIAAVGYHEPSLVFALGTETMLVGAPLAARHLAEDPHCAMVLATAEDEPLLREETERRGIAIRQLGQVDGIDYSIGRRLRLALWRAADPLP